MLHVGVNDQGDQDNILESKLSLKAIQLLVISSQGT